MNSSLLEKEAALAVTAEDTLQEGYDPQRARGTGKERSQHMSGDSSRDTAEDPASESFPCGKYLADVIY